MEVKLPNAIQLAYATKQMYVFISRYYVPHLTMSLNDLVALDKALGEITTARPLSMYVESVPFDATNRLTLLSCISHLYYKTMPVKNILGVLNRELKKASCTAVAANIIAVFKCFEYMCKD